jgi:hypothetical protein
MTRHTCRLETLVTPVQLLWFVGTWKALLTTEVHPCGFPANEAPSAGT